MIMNFIIDLDEKKIIFDVKKFNAAVTYFIVKGQYCSKTIDLIGEQNNVEILRVLKI